MKAITRHKFKILQQIEDVLNQTKICGIANFLIKKTFFIASYSNSVEVDKEIVVKILEEYRDRLEKEIKEEINEEV